MSTNFTEQVDVDNLSEEEVTWLRNWNQHDLIPGEEPEDDEELILDLSTLNKPQMVKEAQKRGLDDSGTKAELQDRIEAYDAEQDYSDEE